MAGTETDFPKSHRDPLYAALDSQTEQKLGLPSGLLSSIRTNGERTDHGRVSEAGAVTPYQFIPSTRDAAVKKYGIDPTLSPQNASEVAGLLLKDSLARNGGDVAQAVGEYHGGTNRDNWGPRTRAYIQRVTAAVQPQQAAGQPAQGQSTFDRVKAQMTPPDTGSIANVFAAYQAGAMTPDEAKQFEGDVKAGHIMLPRGASLKGQAPDSARNSVPQAVLDAYKAGQMSKEEADQFEQDVRSGLATLPPGQVMSSADLIPGAMPTPPRAPEQQRSLGEKVQGAIEAGLNTVSALTGGTAGMAGGMVKQMAKEAINGDFGSKAAADRIEQAAMQGADALTYQPRTQAGQEYSQAIGDAMSQAVPVMPMTAEMGALARGSQPAARMAGDAARATQRVARDSAAQVAKSAQEGAQAVARPVQNVIDRFRPPEPVDVAATTPEQLAQTARTAADGGAGAERATKILAEHAAPDPLIVKSAERLGVQDYLQPDHMTTNEAYRQVVSAIKSSNPGSAVSLAERGGLEQVAQRASKLIDDIGGSSDLSALDSNVKLRIQDSAAAMEKQASALYDAVRRKVSPDIEVSAPETTGFLTKQADELGGADRLLPIEQRLLRTLSKADAESSRVTYAFLDRTRKEIGQAMRKASGPFKDSESGLLKKLYSTLSADQESAANAHGAAAEFAAAKRATALQKGFEDDLSALFGKGLDRSFVGGGENGLPAAFTAVTKGDASPLIRLLSAVPQDMRQQVVASGLSTVFRKAATRGEMDFTGYMKWYDGLRRNRQAYAATMSNLPLSARKQLAALYNVSKGISDSLNRRIKTGAIGTVKAELLGKDTLVDNLYTLARRTAAGAAAEVIATPLGMPGAGITAAFASALGRGKSKALTAVDQLIASPEFAHLVRSEPGTKEAVVAAKRVAKSKPFIEFAKVSKSKSLLEHGDLWLLQNMKPIPVQQQNQQQQHTLH